MLDAYLPPAMIALAAALEQKKRDLERADARAAELEEKNALLQDKLDAAVSSANGKMLQICMLQGKVARLQLSSKEQNKLKEDRVVRVAVEKEMQRLHKQSVDLETSHKEEQDQVKARHAQELRQIETKCTEELNLMEDRLQSMEGMLQANRAALNSREIALRVNQARLEALEAEMEAKVEEFEDEGAMQRARVQTLQSQLGRSLHEVEDQRAALVSLKRRYYDDLSLWLESMDQVLEAAPTNRVTFDPPRPATA